MNDDLADGVGGCGVDVGGGAGVSVGVVALRLRLIHGDCVEAMAAMEPDSVDAIVTDPPYGLEFMGKEWDKFDPSPRKDGTGGLQAPFAQGARAGSNLRDSMPKFQAQMELWARAALRVLKPGGHLLAFGGTRTYHRLTCAIEDAGFEIRDCLAWIYGSGFPKSLDVSKAIDKAAGATREVTGTRAEHNICRPEGGGDERMMDSNGNRETREVQTTAPATEAAQQWDGWGTALKPAHEPIVLARKPISEKNIAANVLKWGTGALNIDGGRIGTGDSLGRFNNEKPAEHRVPDRHPNARNLGRMQQRAAFVDNSKGKGRWPANLILDPEAAAMLDEQSGETQSGSRDAGEYGMMGFHGNGEKPMPAIAGDSGGASRFFYVAKPSTAEREGEDLPLLGITKTPIVHPTMKPVDLMRYLVRLVTPKGGVVLDPFMGSGTTGMAAGREEVGFIGIEKDAGYFEVAKGRIGEFPAIE